MKSKVPKPSISTNHDTPVIVLAAGGNGLLMAETIDRLPGLRCAGFLDDDLKKRAEGVVGMPVLGRLSDWRELPSEYQFIGSLYSPKAMVRYLELVRALAIPDARWAVVIDPKATVSPRASLSPGTFIGPNCVVGPLARLGRWCALLGNTYVGHSTTLGEYVVCANSSSVAGGISVGDGVYLGANCCIREYSVVGSGAVIGGGAVVTKNVSENETVVGNPARPLGIRAAGAPGLTS